MTAINNTPNIFDAKAQNKKTECSNDCHSEKEGLSLDAFTSSHNHDVCNVELLNYYQKALGFFSSTIDYLITEGAKTLQGLTGSLTGINFEKLEVSDEVGNALKSFVVGLDEISNNAEGKDVDITDAINRWFTERNANDVLLVLKAIKNGDCEALNKNPEIAKKITEDLPKLLEILKELQRKDAPQETIDLATSAIDSEMEIVQDLANPEQAKENGLIDEEGIITNKGKEMVADKLEEATEYGKELVTNEKHSQYLSSASKQMLIRWISSTIEFFNNLREEIEKEEEKALEEKKCKERKEGIKKFYALRARKKAIEAKLDEHHAYLKKLNQQFENMLTAIKRLSLQRGGYEERKLISKINYEKDKANEESLRAQNTKNQKREVLHNLPTDTCPEEIYKLNFDLHC